MAKNKNSDFIDVRAIAQDFISKWYIFVISVIVCVALGWLFTKINPPKYAVKANVLITQEEQGGALMKSMGGLGDLFGSRAKVDDEIFVISSHSLYRDVARDLGLNKVHYVKKNLLTNKFAYDDFPIDIIPAPGVVDTLRTSLSFDIKVNAKGLASVKVKARKETLADVKDRSLPVSLTTPFGNFVVDTTAAYAPGKKVNTSISIIGYDAAAEIMAKSVTTSIGSKRSNAIRLGITTVNIDYGKDVLNEILKKYNERGIVEKNLQGEKTAEFIDSRLAIISDDLMESESEIQSYKEKNGIIDVSAEAYYQTQLRGEIDKELVKAETEAEIIKMASDFISQKSNEFSLVPVATDNKGLQDAIKEYNNLLLQRMTLAANAKANNKALQLLDEKIAVMRESITVSINRAYENAMAGVRELKSKMNTTMGRLGTVPSQEREFINMRRQHDVKQQLYLFLLQRREETAMMLANATPKGLIVDEAFALIEPVNLGKNKVLAISAFLGLLLGFLIIYAQKILRTKFATRDELAALTDAPILGEISKSRSTDVLVVKPKTTSSTAELFRLVRSNMLFILGEPSNKVVLMTSTKSGEGKSFISINLAASLAMLGKKVLLVGLDIRRPRLAEYLNMQPNPGFTNYIAGAGQVSLEQIIHKNALIEGMDIVFAGPVPPNPSELLSSDKVDQFFKEMRESYDYIIIDSAPVGMVSDSFSLARVADATVYVCRAEFTTKSDIRMFEDIYDNKRLPNVALVLNGTMAKQGYGYGYGE